MKTPIQIRFSDVDMARHVHNAVYLQWFELARMTILREVAPPVNDWRTEGLILARNEVDYRMPVHLHDKIVTEAWVSKLGDKSFDLQYAVHRTDGADQGICATGRSVMVCFNYLENSTIAIPTAWRTVLEKLLRK
ncbi:MAG: thioesterase family protein [Flavobacteriales bacterium]|nr:acyl-CoA thioesterase [Flavobacteriales bacterium]